MAVGELVEVGVQVAVIQMARPMCCATGATTCLAAVSGAATGGEPASGTIRTAPWQAWTRQPRWTSTGHSARWRMAHLGRAAGSMAPWVNAIGTTRT